MRKLTRAQAASQAAMELEPPLERKTYSIEEAAEVLGTGRNSTLKLIAERRLRKVPGIGKRVRIPVVAIDEFLAD